MVLRRITPDACVSSEANCARSAVAPPYCIQSTAVSTARRSELWSVVSSCEPGADCATLRSNSSGLTSLRSILLRSVCTYSPRSCHKKPSQTAITPRLTQLIWPSSKWRPVSIRSRMPLASPSAERLTTMSRKLFTWARTAVEIGT